MISSAPPSTRPLLSTLALLLLSGCVSDGTDFEALPFYRADRTQPGILRVDLPPLLTTLDTYTPPPPTKGAPSCPPRLLEASSMYIESCIPGPCSSSGQEGMPAMKL